MTIEAQSIDGVLYSEHFAPWCERVRWTMDHHAFKYRIVEHKPWLGEVRLRWKSKTFLDQVTVPLLVTQDVTLMDSVTIARYVDQRGVALTLFPESDLAEIMDWVQWSNVAMQGGRLRLLTHLLNNPQALDAMNPLQGTLGLIKPVIRHATECVVRYLISKYYANQSEGEVINQSLLDFSQLESRVPTIGGFLVANRLTFADIAVACALQFVSPVRHRKIVLGPATQKAWTWPEVESLVPRSLSWRDTLYQAHR